MASVVSALITYTHLVVRWWHLSITSKKTGFGQPATGCRKNQVLTSLVSSTPRIHKTPKIVTIHAKYTSCKQHWIYVMWQPSFCWFFHPGSFGLVWFLCHFACRNYSRNLLTTFVPSVRQKGIEKCSTSIFRHCLPSTERHLVDGEIIIYGKIALAIIVCCTPVYCTLTISCKCWTRSVNREGFKSKQPSVSYWTTLNCC